MLKKGLLAAATAALIGASSSAWAGFDAIDDMFSVVPGKKVSFTADDVLDNDVCTGDCERPLRFKGVVSNDGFKKTGIIDLPGGRYGTGGRLKFKPNGKIVFFAGKNFKAARFGYGLNDAKMRFALGLIRFNVSPS